MHIFKRPLPLAILLSVAVWLIADAVSRSSIQFHIGSLPTLTSWPAMLAVPVLLFAMLAVAVLAGAALINRERG